MNAPDPLTHPAGAVLIARAPVTEFGASLTNRKHRPEHIANLAASIKQHGVIQPITVRPWPASRPQPDGILYEIVVGEGRWLGAIEAKLADIPFFWRDLADKEAVELQLIENLQRDDISALEEAQAYRRLIDEHGHTADTIAAQVGKSRSAIYNSLKLLDLCPAALKVARDHHLDASLMMLAARIPDEKLQIAAIKEMAPHYAEDDGMSYRRARDMVHRRYMLKLAEAPFSRTDAELLPAAGTCQACPKRTGNAADLFTDVTNADICTDPGCFDAKKAAHVDRQRAQAKANNIKVIEGAAAKKIMPNSYSGDLAGGYIDLDKKMYSDPKNRTVRQILGKDAPAAEALLISPHEKGKVIEVISTATIKEKLAAKGAAVPDEIVRRGKSDAEKEAERKRKQEALYRQRLFDTTRGAIAVSFDTRDDDSVLDLREFRQVADLLYHCLQFEDQKRLARMWIGPTDKTDDHDLVRQLKKRIVAMERKDCARLMLEASLVGEIVPGYGSHTPENLLATADALDIDAAVIKKGVISEMREKAKAKTKPAAKAKPAPEVQPETALPADEPLIVGDRVRINDTVTAPLGSAYIGEEGRVTSLIGEAFMVRLPARRNVSTSYIRSELDKLPALGAKPASTPTPAARAGDNGASAAPAGPKAKAQRKPKAKTDPAPASPANEAAAPPNPPRAESDRLALPAGCAHMSWILTALGKHFSDLNPHPDDIPF